MERSRDGILVFYSRQVDFLTLIYIDLIVRNGSNISLLTAYIRIPDTETYTDQNVAKCTAWSAAVSSLHCLWKF